MQIYGLSPSSIETFETCQWKFFLQAVLKKPDLSGSSASLGHMVHKICEIMSRGVLNRKPKNSKIFNLDYLWHAVYNHYMTKEVQEPDKIDSAKLKKILLGLVELMDSEYTPISDRIIDVENYAKIPMKIGDETMIIRGIIDRVDKIDDKTIEILDYKSGSRANYDDKERGKKDSKWLYNAIQPRVYHLASKQIYPWAHNVIVTFIYIADGGPISVAFGDNDVQVTQEILRQKYLTIRGNNDPQRIKGQSGHIPWQCKYMCSHHKSGVCDNVWAEKNDIGIELTINKYNVIREEKKRKF